MLNNYFQLNILIIHLCPRTRSFRNVILNHVIPNNVNLKTSFRTCFGILSFQVLRNLYLFQNLFISETKSAGGNTKGDKTKK